MMRWTFFDRDLIGTTIGWAGLALGLAGALVAQGAGARETFEDTTTTLLVEVPVEVTVDGEPVRGLGIEDFELYDKGDRQEILSVEMIDLATVETSAEAPIGDVPVVARRHFMLLFDLSFSSVKGIERSRQAALELVREQLHPADLVSIATWSLTTGPEILLGFTPDRGQVEKIIESLEGRSGLIVQSDPLRIAVSDASLRGSGGDGGGPGGGARGGGIDRGAEAAAHFRDIGLMADRSEANQGRREITEMSRGIESLAEVLRSVSGRKHVVFFSQGFDSNLLLGATDDKRRQEMLLEVQTTGDLSRVDSEEYFGSATAFNVLDDMVEGLRRADCTVHTVDAGGLRAGGTVGAAQRGSKDGLFMIAEGTGGDFYENFNHLGQAMSQMLERTSVTYLLTFQPDRVKPNGKYRKLKVEVKDLPRRRSKVVHRPGWFAPDAEAEANGLEQQFDVAQRLWDAREGGDIRARALAAPLRTESQRHGGPAYVPVLVEVDGPSFLAGEPLPTGDDEVSSEPVAEIFLYALSIGGQIVDHFAQRLPLDPRAIGEPLTDRGFKLYAPMLLDEGTYSLRVLVRNAATGRTGLSIARLDVHETDAEAPVLMPPFFPEPTDRWVLVRGRRAELEADQEPAYPFFHGQTTFLPSVRPSLRPGDGVPVFLAAYGLDDGVTDLDSALYSLEDGSQVIKPRWKLDPRLDFGDEGLARTIAAFEVPNVPPGEYELRMTLTSAAGAESTEGRLRMRVIGTDDPGASSLLALSAPIRFDDVPDPNQPTDGERRAAQPVPAEDIPLDALDEGYRQLLDSLGDTSRAALAVELATLESRIAGDDPESRWSKIARAELKVARRLAASDPEALVPLIMLHHEAYREHELRHRPYLEFHSLAMVRELADLYVGRGRTEGARVVAARALTSLGGHLQSHGRLAGAELFERAIELDPSNEAALLGLAAYREKRGGPYDEAADYLDRLIIRRPESREGRLRLAVNQLRVADEKGTVNRDELRETAESHLRHLVDQPTVDWIYSLAIQELASHLADGRLDDATALLRAAIDKRPEDQKLHVLLSYLLDRGRRSREAGSLAVRVADDLTTTAPADRGRYNRWPTGALQVDREELRNGAAQRMPQFQAAVARVVQGADR